MTFFALLGAIALAVFVFELTSGLQAVFSPFGRTHRLMGARSSEGDSFAPKRRSTWEAILVGIFPNRFDPEYARSYADVVGLLRRAGYPYDTPGDFYAAAVRTFGIYLALGAVWAGIMYAYGYIFAVPIVAALMIFQGLRKPYTKLKQLAKKRAELMRNNMLVGLATLGSLLASGMGVQEAMRRTASVGGPFCNLLGLLVARMEIEDLEKAFEVTRAHIPDPRDVEVNLFLRDVHDFFVYNRPLLTSVQALTDAVHRNMIDATEARAALVRQRSGLFGVLAVLGLLFSVVAPFLFA
ncbi:MAG: hypothetical protein HPY45_17885 [Anaerolineae bacterium]|nr:hypothetical protein [Anaerolineae bacterium]